MKQLLFHSYHFPPIGGSGAQRPLKLVRHLAALGYESLVVTGGGATSDRWAPEDASLLGEVPEGVEICRVDGDGEPQLSAGWRRAGERWLGIPDRWARWWADSSYHLGREVGTGSDLIYVWMQPYASAPTGAALSKSLGIPWVADLGDPWALDENMIYASALHRGRALKEMGELLGTASAIVMSTPEAVDRLLQAFPHFADRPVVPIANGFEAADFARPRTPRADGKFRIVHTGYLHTEIGEQHRRRRVLRSLLRASPPGLDILTRSHTFLVEAIERLIAREPELGDVLELQLAGVLNETDRRVAGRTKVATIRGYVTHAESVELMQSADLLFLPMQNLPPGVRATIVPGKTYEYLASGTPILAAVPDGDARDILVEAGNAIIVRPDDLEGMAAGIRAQIERARAGEPPRSPDANVVARFEYGRLAADLAGVFDAVLERSSRPVRRTPAAAQEGASNQP
jgi:glycosyltransferase involved in cell wall biosynthesis